MPQMQILLMQMYTLKWRWSACSCANVEPMWYASSTYDPDSIDYNTAGEAYAAAEAHRLWFAKTSRSRKTNLAGTCMFGLKLYMIIYAASGLIGGVVGPVPVHHNCITYIEDAVHKMRNRPDLEQLTFTCEWRRKRPALTAR